MESRSVKLFIYRCVYKKKKKKRKKRRQLRSLENWDDASVLASRHHLRRRRRKRKVTVLLFFQIFLPVKLVWKWDCGGEAAQLDSLDPCFHSWKKNKNTASGGDVRVLVRREDQGNDNPQCTPPSLPPSPCILHYLHLSTVLDPWPPWHHTEWVFSMITREQGIKKTSKTGMEGFLLPLWRSNKVFLFFFKNPWGVKQQKSWSLLITVAFSLAWSSAATQRWTLECDIHKNMPILFVNIR